MWWEVEEEDEGKEDRGRMNAVEMDGMGMGWDGMGWLLLFSLSPEEMVFPLYLLLVSLLSLPTAAAPRQTGR